MLLTIYDSFPQWMGVHCTFDFIVFIFAVVLVTTFYFILGYGLCACNYHNPYVRCVIMILWPLYVVIQFLIFPFRVLHYLSTEKENGHEHRK